VKQPGYTQDHVARVAPAALCVFTASLLHCFTAQAMDIEKSAAHYADKKYEYTLTATLDAPLEQVKSVLRDYERYTRLDPRILEAKVLERPEDCVAVLETTLRMCLGPFCKNVKRVERVQELPSGLIAIADPAKSDVKFGETHVEIATEEGRTRVTYRTQITPDFWIPSLIGRRYMLSTLEEATTNMFRQVEREAQVLPGH
jgi:hypothetical protein